MDEKIRAMEQQMTTLEGAELERVLNQYHKLQTAFEDGEGYTYKSKVLGVINGLGFRGEAMHQWHQQSLRWTKNKGCSW